MVRTNSPCRSIIRILLGLQYFPFVSWPMTIETGRGVSGYGCPFAPTDSPAYFRLGASCSPAVEEVYERKIEIIERSAPRFYAITSENNSTLNQVLLRREPKMYRRSQRRSVKIYPCVRNHSHVGRGAANAGYIRHGAACVCDSRQLSIAIEATRVVIGRFTCT